MNVAARTLLVMHSDEPFRQQLQETVLDLFEMKTVNSWSALRAQVRDLPPASVILVDPFANLASARDPEQLAPQLHDLLANYPSATVIAALRFDLGDYRDLRQLDSWGISEIVRIDEESTPESLRRVLRAARSEPLRALLVGELPIPLPGRARAIMAAAVDTVTEGGHPKDLARSMGLSIATLRRWCESAKLPPPRNLLIWMRVLLAASLLDDPGHTVFSVAKACGYSSDQALRRAIKRVVDATPGDLREMGAYETVSRGFFEDLTKTAAFYTSQQANS